MKKIYKYEFPLPSLGRLEINMPLGAQIVSIQSQAQAFISIWAIVNPEQESFSRYFWIMGTGEEIFEPKGGGEKLYYLATVLDYGMVWRVFEQAPYSQSPINIDGTPIERLGLSVRVFNSLKREGIKSVEEVIAMLITNPDWIITIRNFGVKSMVELRDSLLKYLNFTPIGE